MANESDSDYFICAACDGIVYASGIENHDCFRVQSTNIDNKDRQQDPKTNMTWDNASTLALLTVYEAVAEETGTVRRKKNLWNTLSQQLSHMGIYVTADQARWKVNALLVKYNKCKDENKQSGRGRSTFEYYERFDKLLGYRESSVENQATSSGLPENQTEERRKVDKEEMGPSTLSKRTGHVEQQLLKYIESSESHREEERRKKDEYRRKQVELKEKQLEDKKRRHEEVMQAEKEKRDLLKQLLNKN